MPNPFGSTFESFGAPRGPLVEKVHQAQFETLVDLLEEGEGQLISLRAPRAGYGKTMLLSRLQQARQAHTLFIPVHLADGRRVEGEMILEEILTQMSESLPAGGGLTRLDLCARKLFAQGLVHMVYSGEVPCQDRDGALASLHDRPAEAFDFHNEGAAIAQWSREQFALLGPRLSTVISKSSGASSRDVSYWNDLFFNYATRTPVDVARTSDLMDAVFGVKSRFRSGAGFLEGLSALINLITVVEPMVMVLDEVDGLSSDSDSALRAASCLTSLWEAAPRLSLILSINDDVWGSAFAPRLPLGLKDRLEDVIVRLDSLTGEEARALVTVRAGDEAAKVIQHLNLDEGTLYPRDILKKARSAWEKRDQPVESFSSAEPAAVVYQKPLVAPEQVKNEVEPIIEVEDSAVTQAQISMPEPTPSKERAPEVGTGPLIFNMHPSSKRDEVLGIEIGDDFARAPSTNREVAVSPFAVAAPEPLSTPVGIYQAAAVPIASPFSVNPQQIPPTQFTPANAEPSQASVPNHKPEDGSSPFSLSSASAPTQSPASPEPFTAVASPAQPYPQQVAPPQQAAVAPSSPFTQVSQAPVASVFQQ